MKVLFAPLICAVLLTASTSFAQISFGGAPLGHARPGDLPTAPIVTMPAVDVEALMAEDEQRIALGVKGPWRFGYNHMVDLDLENSGIWTELTNGDKVWRLTIECPGAYSINFEFHDYVIPEGAQVFVYNDGAESLGSFTAESNPGENVLGVTQLSGESITIEYIEPASVQGEGRLRVGQVTHAYRDVLNKMRGLGDSGNCNNNVICPVGDEWRDQIRSVAIITVGGSGFCTGQLLNNCENDGIPYFLTAKHCVTGTTNTWVYRFNWDSPMCNQNQNGPMNQTVSGSSIKVTSAGSDVALLELNTTPPTSYDVFYSGWDRSTSPPTASTAIHHPSGDVKKISFDQHSATTATINLGDGPAQCWRIANWEDGTTEGGSSGSGLWNQNGLLVGQLYGGSASCANNVNDYYGRFDISYPLLEPWLGNCGSQLNGHPVTGVSVGEIKRMAFEMFPNPTSGIITLIMPGSIGANTGLRVFDSSGRMVHAERVPNLASRSDVDLGHLDDGIYIMELEGEGLREQRTLILAR